MIQNNEVISIIAARGGSKGLPKKNILSLAGKPLIAWSIESAMQSHFIDRCIVSSEDSKIIEIARSFGADVPFVRPKNLAQDDSSVEEVICHALDQLSVTSGYLVLLQPTSPLRSADDIDACICLCRDHAAPACVSIAAAGKPPEWMFQLDSRKHLKPLFRDGDTPYRRQSATTAWLPNGAVYVARIDWFLANKTFYTPETLGYVMPPERSIDIDSKLDMVVAEAIMKMKHPERLTA